MMLMSREPEPITGNDSMYDTVPTASDVSVRFNITVRRAHEFVLTDNPFTQNIRPSRKEEIHAAKQITMDVTCSGVMRSGDNLFL